MQRLLNQFMFVDRYMWSDTGSFEYGARGDMEFVHNPDGYNFAAPGMAGTTQNY